MFLWSFLVSLPQNHKLKLSFSLLGGGDQRLRAHLYGSLLYYLQIAQKPEEPDTLQTGTAQDE